MSVVLVNCWLFTNFLSNSFDVFSIKKYFLSVFLSIFVNGIEVVDVLAKVLYLIFAKIKLV